MYFYRNGKKTQYDGNENNQIGKQVKNTLDWKTNKGNVILVVIGIVMVAILWMFLIYKVDNQTWKRMKKSWQNLFN
jgi:hypothetical protein